MRLFPSLIGSLILRHVKTQWFILRRSHLSNYGSWQYMVGKVGSLSFQLFEHSIPNWTINVVRVTNKFTIIWNIIYNIYISANVGALTKTRIHDQTGCGNNDNSDVYKLSRSGALPLDSVYCHWNDIYIGVGLKVLRVTNILSWNETKWGLSFLIGLLSVNTHLPSVLPCLKSIC